MSPVRSGLLAALFGTLNTITVRPACPPLFEGKEGSRSTLEEDDSVTVTSRVGAPKPRGSLVPHKNPSVSAASSPSALPSPPFKVPPGSGDSDFLTWLSPRGRPTDPGLFRSRRRRRRSSSCGGALSAPATDRFPALLSFLESRGRGGSPGCPRCRRIPTIGGIKVLVFLFYCREE